MAFEPLYDSLIPVARGLTKLWGVRLVVTGEENVPRKGGALFTANHTGYVDFFFVALTLVRYKRHCRFMAKQEIFENKFAGPLMRGLGHISVDRIAGRQALNRAEEVLRSGEAVCIFPEGTISNSFEIREMKTGAVRVAQVSGVNIYPVVLWGSHRLYRRDIKPNVKERGIGVMVHYCPPFDPSGDLEEVTNRLRVHMQSELEKVQEAYAAEFGPFKPGLPWMPARLGGSAPTLTVAQQADELVDAERDNARDLLRTSSRAASQVHSVLLTDKEATGAESRPEQRLSRLSRLREAAQDLAEAAQDLAEASKKQGEIAKRKAGTGSLRNMTEMVASAAVELERATVLSGRRASRGLGASSDSVTEFATGFRHRMAKSLHSGADYLAVKSQWLLDSLESAEKAARESVEERAERHAVARERRREQATADAVRRENAELESSIKHAHRDSERKKHEEAALIAAMAAVEETTAAAREVVSVEMVHDEEGDLGKPVADDLGDIFGLYEDDDSGNAPQDVE